MNTYKLFEVVLQHSESKHINEALNEWNITNHKRHNTACICGKQHIIDTYELTNKHNGNILYPIGSSCIKKFENDNLNQQIKTLALGKKIFKNVGRKHNGLTYDEIIEKDPQYVKFLSSNVVGKIYNDLVKYYDFKSKLKN